MRPFLPVPTIDAKTMLDSSASLRADGLADGVIAAVDEVVDEAELG